MAGASADRASIGSPSNVDYEGYTKERLKIQGGSRADALKRAFPVCQIGNTRRLQISGSGSTAARSFDAPQRPAQLPQRDDSLFLP